MFNPATLWTAPEVNPVNQKARSIPMFNPINKYGRVFNFSWFGFMIAFLSWYAFPPLLGDVIRMDMKLTKVEVANSNIIALTATLLVRLVAGPSCDKYGPRKTFAGLLILGAIPTFLAGTIKTAAGLYTIRFFIGILGGSFVPCQVWTTGFFDKNIIGTANSLTAGLGNAGGGITYFVMPAVYNSLRVQRHMTPHVAWRVSFIVPGILILSVAACLLLFCQDTPTGAWADRNAAIEQNMRAHSMVGVVDVPGDISAEKEHLALRTGSSPFASDSEDTKKDVGPGNGVFADGEAQLTPDQMLDTAKGEVVRAPTMREILRVFLSPQTFVTAACYFCTFGAELSINSILGTYYQANFKLNLQQAGNWAAMFGLLNVVFRPIGGLASDFVYRRTGSVWSKKMLLHGYSIITGGFLVAIGVVNSKNKSTMFGLIAGMAFFLEGSNGVNYSVVPHVHPHANGVISGFTGAAGNFGGIIFAIIFRYLGVHYGKAIWIIGVITIAVNLAVSWIRPIPKGQIGGH